MKGKFTTVRIQSVIFQAGYKMGAGLWKIAANAGS